jgi:hypothetical protein
MANFNKDIILLILNELQLDKNSLYSCLLINKFWCETTIPILWKNPWKDLPREKEKSQSKVIVSHLSNEVRENLKRKHDIILPEAMKLSFNYISFCRYLELYRLDRITFTIKNIKKSKIPHIKLEIMRLFINRNTRFTHLNIHQFDFQTNLIPGIEICFSKLKFLRSQPNNFLNELSKISNSIEKLEYYIKERNNNDNHGIIKLIEAQKNLNYVTFTYENGDESLCKTLGNSLIKHADTLQYLKLNLELITTITKSLSYLVNLSSLEIKINPNHQRTWDHMENVSFPFLKFLKTHQVSTKSLINLIENTKGQLIEISIDYENDDKKLIQTIYKNCPKLKYLSLSIRNKNPIHGITELDDFLINCQYLNGLVIIISTRENFDWDNFFKSLAKSSPNCLFKFKFFTTWENYKLESLKLFFDNWKGRHPMLLYTSLFNDKENLDLIKKYVAEGIIKKHENVSDKTIFEDFEWTHPYKFENNDNGTQNIKL